MPTVEAPGRRRPNLSQAVTALIRDVAERMPEFAHVDAGRILVVHGEARRTSRATIRPLHFAETHGRMSRTRRLKKPLVKVGGKKILYTITLRPMFFRASTPEERIRTILHELFHISRRFDGTLHSGRRHDKLPPRKWRVRFEPAARRYLALAPAEIRAPFALDQEVWVRAWLEKPARAYPAGSDDGGRLRYAGRRVYTEKQLYQTPVRMITKRPETEHR